MYLGRYNTDVYWNRRNQSICFAFIVNEYSWFEHCNTRSRYYGNIVSISKKSGDFQKDCFFKGWITKYTWCNIVIAVKAKINCNFTQVVIINGKYLQM